VSPTPARTSEAQIVAAARSLLEEEGLEAVTMASVAARVGVRPPSLYKHVRDRAALLDAVAADAAGELGRVLAGAAAGAGDDPEARIAALAHAYRAFAHRTPRVASILFTDLGPGTGASVDIAAAAARPVVEAAAALVGPADALPAARVLTSFAHGFTSMELAGAFRLGGNVDDAFALGIETLIAGLRRGDRGAAGEGADGKPSPPSAR
jgi:AcrR family transcriptional regulator